MNIKRFLRNLVLVLITVFWSTLIQMLNGDKTIFSLFKTTKSTEESWIVFSLSIAMVFFISWSCKQIVNTFKIRPNSVLVLRQPSASSYPVIIFTISISSLRIHRKPSKSWKASDSDCSHSLPTAGRI